jgi:WD40 repeat protein
MLPERRLAVLLDELKGSQIDKCLYHTSNEPPTLYTDHTCDRSQFPSEVAAELSNLGVEASKQPEEVWQLRFSPDGRRLASCGTEKAVNIWDVENLKLIQELQGHPKGEIGDLAWSPDSKLLVTCGIDRYAKLWNTDVSTFPAASRRLAVMLIVCCRPVSA